ncbi:MAG: AAA family ATPase [Candidatus Methylacidiphilales bacterium]|nr:AAA family ATPase [Candidatus Methylacidiphilales bacterium]
MKITRISLQGFRAFDEPFELDLDGGKNLLLHGENGSGKSSIFFALKRFFEERGDDITQHRNHFSPETRTPSVLLQIQGTDAAGAAHDHAFHWDVADGHPLPVPKDPATAPISKELRALLVDAARRAGLVDYRAMLRTHLLTSPLSRSARGPAVHATIYGNESKGLDAQLFDLVSLVVLAGARVTVAGGGETTLGELMRRVWETRPTSRYKNSLRRANAATQAFNQAFNAKLPELQTKLTEFLNYFENHSLEITFNPISLAWEKSSLELQGAELRPEIKFRGKSLTNHHQFLNEARLSALATCLFLAGVWLSDNDYTNPAYPRFLVLDDALIGLELQNRVPVLKILTSSAFKHYQIILLTHDRVWFDLARGHLREKDGWLHRELFADEDTGHLIPKLRAAESDLSRAKTHLANNDLKAAAVYARSAFEWKLRLICENHGIPVPFKSDADKIAAGVLWDGILHRQREREAQRAKGSVVPDLVPAGLEKEVDVMRSTVLNKLSHAGSSGLVASEVAGALTTVKKVHDHQFPKITKTP